MESIAELKKRVQEPVRRHNDVAGLLVGDRVSIHLTRLFLALRWSPTVATIAMLVSGIVGSVLIAFGGVASVAGFFCLFLYYIFDCVDGEVARYHHGEKLIWSFHDFMFSLYVKAAFFVGLGIWATQQTGRPWMFAFALAGLIATFLGKFLHDLEVILTCRQVLLRGVDERQRFVDQVLEGAGPEVVESDLDQRSDEPPYRPRGFLSFLRVAITNFDLAILAFLAAALLDLFVPRFSAWGIEGDCKLVLYVFYGVAWPLDFLDQLRSKVRKERCLGEVRVILRRAHHFRIR